MPGRAHFLKIHKLAHLPDQDKVKAFIEWYEVQIPVTEDSGCFVAKTLVYCIWSESELDYDPAESFATFDGFENGGRSIALPHHQIDSSHSPAIQNKHAELTRGSIHQMWNDIAKLLSHEKSRFSDKIIKIRPKFVAIYSRMIPEMELLDDSKKKFFIEHTPRDNAFKFYQNKVVKYATTFIVTSTYMNKEFWSNVMLEFIAHKLQSLQIPKF